jgi:iron uptake system component EfeO
LWSDSTPDYVVKFEKALPGYKAAAFPKTKEEAEGFKNALCARLVRDTKKMQTDFGTVALDATSAFRGMILSVQEQSEKTNKAASGEDESRYAQNTLADMRANLEGAHAVYDAFQPWIQATKGDIVSIEAGLNKLSKAYGAVDGDALPKVPDGFDPDKPTDEHLDTAYGKLWKLLSEQTDAEDKGSLVWIMSDAADRMDIPGIAAEK